MRRFHQVWPTEVEWITIIFIWVYAKISSRREIRDHQITKDHWHTRVWSGYQVHTFFLLPPYNSYFEQITPAIQVMPCYAFINDTYCNYTTFSGTDVSGTSTEQKHAFPTALFYFDGQHHNNQDWLTDSFQLKHAPYLWRNPQIFIWKYQIYSVFSEIFKTNPFKRYFSASL